MPSVQGVQPLNEASSLTTATCGGKIPTNVILEPGLPMKELQEWLSTCQCAASSQPGATVTVASRSSVGSFWNHFGWPSVDIAIGSMPTTVPPPAEA